MEIKVQAGTEEKTYDVPEDIVALVEEAMTGAVRSDNTLRVIYKPLVEAFYGGPPEGGELLANHVARIKLGRKGDRFAWDGLYEVLMMKHPQTPELRSIEFQLLEGRGTPQERVQMKVIRNDLGRRIRSMAAGMRSRLMRYYLADFAPVRGIAAIVPARDVRGMVARTIRQFQSIVDKPEKYSTEEALLALNVVTLLHSLIGEPTPLPSPAFAAHLAAEAQRETNHHAETTH